MPILGWSDRYNINVLEIDNQHKQLLELVNKLHAAVESCGDKEDLRVKLVELAEFSRFHFAAEEELMKKNGYPELVKHQKEHRTLSRHLRDLVYTVSNGKRPTFCSDYDVSTDWALNHILECDQNLGVFLNSKDIF